MTSDDWITSTPEGVDRIIDRHLEAPDDVYTDQDGSYPRPSTDVLEATRALGKAVLDGIADEVDITDDVMGGMAIYYDDVYIGIMNSRRFPFLLHTNRSSRETTFKHYEKLDELLKELR